MPSLYDLIEKADRYYDESRYDECIQLLRGLQNKFPDSDDFANSMYKAMSLRIMAQAYEKLDKLDTALSTLEKYSLS